MHFLAMLVGLAVTIAVGAVILIAVILLGLGLAPVQVVIVLIAIVVAGSALTYFILRKMTEATVRFYHRLREPPASGEK